MHQQVIPTVPQMYLAYSAHVIIRERARRVKLYGPVVFHLPQGREPDGSLNCMDPLSSISPYSLQLANMHNVLLPRTIHIPKTPHLRAVAVKRHELGICRVCVARRWSHRLNRWWRRGWRWLSGQLVRKDVNFTDSAE